MDRGEPADDNDRFWANINVLDETTNIDLPLDGSPSGIDGFPNTHSSTIAPIITCILSSQLGVACGEGYLNMGQGHGGPIGEQCPLSNLDSNASHGGRGPLLASGINFVNRGNYIILSSYRAPHIAW